MNIYYNQNVLTFGFRWSTEKPWPSLNSFQAPERISSGTRRTGSGWRGTERSKCWTCLLEYRGSQLRWPHSVVNTNCTPTYSTVHGKRRCRSRKARRSCSRPLAQSGDSLDIHGGVDRWRPLFLVQASLKVCSTTSTTSSTVQSGMRHVESRTDEATFSMVLRDVAKAASLQLWQVTSLHFASFVL